MTHFTVLTRIDSADTADEALAKLEKLMAPYQENMGDCPEEFLEFTDVEDAKFEDYQTGSTEMVELPDGSRVLPWDEAFRIPGTLGLGSVGSTHVVPNDLKRIDVPHAERFATFEDFMRDCHGMRSRDEKTGRYGYWENQNTKWDYWSVYAFEWPTSSGPVEAEFIRRSQVDVAAAEEQALSAAADFYRTLNAMRSRSAPPRHDGRLDEYECYRARCKALDIGAIEVRQGPPLPGEGGRAVPWSVPSTDDRYVWHDIYDPATTAEEFAEKYAAQFFPLRGYAYLDSNGWHEPGRIGWLACSSATPDTVKKTSNDLISWFKESPEDSWFVKVDCHI